MQYYYSNVPFAYSVDSCLDVYCQCSTSISKCKNDESTSGAFASGEFATLHCSKYFAGWKGSVCQKWSDIQVPCQEIDCKVLFQLEAVACAEFALGEKSSIIAVDIPVQTETFIDCGDEHCLDPDACVRGALATDATESRICLSTDDCLLSRKTLPTSIDGEIQSSFPLSSTETTMAPIVISDTSVDGVVLPLGALIGVAAGVFLLLASLIGLLIWFNRRRDEPTSAHPPPQQVNYGDFTEIPEMQSARDVDEQNKSNAFSAGYQAMPMVNGRHAGGQYDDASHLQSNSQQYVGATQLLGRPSSSSNANEQYIGLYMNGNEGN